MRVMCGTRVMLLFFGIREYIFMPNLYAFRNFDYNSTHEHATKVLKHHADWLTITLEIGYCLMPSKQRRVTNMRPFLSDRLRKYLQDRVLVKSIWDPNTLDHNQKILVWPVFFKLIVLQTKWKKWWVTRLCSWNGRSLISCLICSDTKNNKTFFNTGDFVDWADIS